MPKRKIIMASKSKLVTRVISLNREAVPVRFRRFRRHITVSAPGLPRLSVVVEEGKFYAGLRTGAQWKSWEEGGTPAAAFARAVRTFWA